MYAIEVLVSNLYDDHSVVSMDLFVVVVDVVVDVVVVVVAST